jgi:hypothetical protein
VLQLFQSELELVVESGFLYVPLLFDPDIAKEVQDRCTAGTSPGRDVQEEVRTLVELDGRPFIRSVSIQSVLVNYGRIDPAHYELLKADLLGDQEDLPEVMEISPRGKLQTIVLGIMPHFVRKTRGLERRPFNDDAFMDFICSRIEIPAHFMREAERILDSDPIRRRLNHYRQLKETVTPMPEGRITGDLLHQWLLAALKGRMVNHERTRLEQQLHERERWGESKKKHIAAMLYLGHKGSFELDGFGFSRIGSRNEYLIYKRTGEYILKDYYAQRYRFPDCRVAVSTAGSLKPLVLESYKHPFLLHHAPKQEICLSGYNWPDEFNAENIIRLLEDGINALLYGYDARRRNGYHSLDRTLYYVKTIEFEDYRV